MPSISLNDTPFDGRTSPLPSGGEPPSLKCRRCGSALAGRREKMRRQTTAGIRYVVDTFRCRCGRGRHVRRPVKGAA
jgi:hypothetical protein